VPRSTEGQHSTDSIHGARDNVQLARHTPCNRHHEIGTRCDTEHATCLLENGRVTLALAVDSALQCADARVNNRVHESREPCRSYSHGTLKRVCRAYRMAQGLLFRTALTLPTDRSSAELRAGFKFLREASGTLSRKETGHTHTQARAHTHTHTPQLDAAMYIHERTCTHLHTCTRPRVRTPARTYSFTRSEIACVRALRYRLCARRSRRDA
jgi:hypothetical protein